MSCVEKAGNAVEHSISSAFGKLGCYVGTKPKRTILFSILLTVVCGAGFMSWTTENRIFKLWVPQNTDAEIAALRYEEYFESTSRVNSLLLKSSSSSDKNVLTQQHLIDGLSIHNQIENGVSTVNNIDYQLTDLCTKSYGSCASSIEGACSCLVSSVFKVWNYDLEALKSDTDVIQTLNSGLSKGDLETLLGAPLFDSNDQIVSAEAFTMTYFLKDRTDEAGSDEAGTDDDPINEAWELDVFLSTAESIPTTYNNLTANYFAGRSFSDEFGSAITGDIALVNISYLIIFLFLGANLGSTFKCGRGSRWTLCLGALFMIGLSTGAGFGVSSGVGLFYGPVHSLLPFILLGIGVDDAFVIVNAIDRERKCKRTSESNDALASRIGRGLARAGASITVTSATDAVAFGISSSSSLPALASFCGYASIAILFLWLFASTFFTATVVLDERRQRDDRKECLCCVTRKRNNGEDDDNNKEDEAFEENKLPRYFRNYHAPAILSQTGKAIVLVFFATLLGLGSWGAVNLSVEDTSRAFIPEGSYVTDFIESSDEYFPGNGIEFFFVFEGSSDIYKSAKQLATLGSRLEGLSTDKPYIAEPNDGTYRNVFEGFSSHLSVTDTVWPSTESDFVAALQQYASMTNLQDGGSKYALDIKYSEDMTKIEAVRIQSSYVSLKKNNRGKVIDDSDKQIEAMDVTRDLVSSWDDLPSSRFAHSPQYVTVETFKIIRRELFLNVGLALLAVSVIVLITIGSPMTALLVTVNVAFCILEILGAMYYLGIAIDSVSVINIVLAVGLSIDYSAHIGHCFMQKGSEDKNVRAVEALADIGAAVLNGALTTFLAVVVLLFSSSYVFVILSKQFALTVGLGVLHGLVLLPVLLSILGPKAFDSAEQLDDVKGDDKKQQTETTHHHISEPSQKVGNNDLELQEIMAADEP